MSTQTQEQPSVRRPLFRRWLIARGESAVFSGGLAVVGVVIGVLAASSWWTLETYRSSLVKGRERAVQAASVLIADAASTELAEGDLTTLRKLVQNTAKELDLTTCRVKLLDGRTVAASDVKSISKDLAGHDTLPETLPDGPAAEMFEHRHGFVCASLPLEVAGRGKALLEIESPIEFPLLANWEVEAGLGGISVAGMLGLFGAYRLIRRKLRGLGAIGEALRLSGAGEGSAAALRVGDSYGSEAAAWNRLVEERESLRQQLLVQKAAEKVMSRGAGEGDLAGAFDAMWSGILIIDDTGKVRYANGAAGVLLQRKREELSGAEMMAVVNDPAAEPILSVATGKLRQRTSIELERRSERGERTTLRLTARPMRREDHASAVVLVEDVTQQKVADESRNAFVAQATHELRTPLTNIRLYVETMVDDGENDPQIRAKCLNVIGNEARRLERIVSDMLSVSEIEAGSLKLRAGDIRLDALFEELHADFKAQAEDKEIKLNFALPPKLPVMTGDRDKLMLALHNLVGNALKYTPVGGVVTVQIDAGAELRVAVTDNGIGISPDEQELIFEKFYRAKDRRIAGITGSGIGLALARQVVRMHGGDITVTSQIDKGSTFTLTVPVSAPVKAAA
ncbi:MAG TPA: ATP-binding protein [Phycisphaerales bacterium]|nr:ATP-binding protein [Phycisphaerales bacterium]